MLTDACSPCSLQPNTSADRLATLPRICSRVDSSFIPSKSYPLTRSIVDAASSASLLRTIADSASSDWVFFSVQIVCICAFTFVNPSRQARLLRVSIGTLKSSAIAFHPFPVRYSAFALSHCAFVMLSGSAVALPVATPFPLFVFPRFPKQIPRFPPFQKYFLFFFDSFPTLPHSVPVNETLHLETTGHCCLRHPFHPCNRLSRIILRHYPQPLIP